MWCAETAHGGWLGRCARMCPFVSLALCLCAWRRCDVRAVTEQRVRAARKGRGAQTLALFAARRWRVLLASYAPH